MAWIAQTQGDADLNLPGNRTSVLLMMVSAASVKFCLRFCLIIAALAE
jgi:hypothetical protein